MIASSYGVKDARDNFADLLGAVYYGRQPVIIEKKGKAVAVVINPEDFLNYQKSAKDRFFEIVNQLQASNKNKKDAEITRDITSAVAVARSKRYGRSV